MQTEHAWRALRTAVTVVVAALPVVAADPAVRNLITSHPWLGAYFPVATATSYALYRAARPPSPAPVAPSPAPGDGAPTMGAK